MENMAIANRIDDIKLVKKKTGLSNEKIAREIGVTIGTIHRWFNAGVEPKSDAVLANIDRFLGKNRQFLNR